MGSTRVWTAVAFASLLGCGAGDDATRGAERPPASRAAPSERASARPTSGPSSAGPGPLTTGPSGPAVPAADLSYRALACGPHQACAITTAGELACWGSNAAGQVGVPASVVAQPAVLVPDANGSTRVFAGPSRTCALGPDDSVRCWGAADVPRIERRLVQLALGEQSGCALDDAGGVWCWGDNRFAQLGRPLPSADPSAQLVAGIERATDLATGPAHVCAVDAAGRVLCWGRNDAGQLGDGRPVGGERPGPNETTGTEMQPYDGPCGARGLDCLDERQVRVRIRPAAAPVVGLDAVRTIAVGQAHACAVRADGAVACWGANWLGQLGRRPGAASSRPVAVRGVTEAVAVAAGMFHTCALTAAGRVVCWGGNRQGALGDGTTTDRATPAAVPGLERVVELAAAGMQTCARQHDGRVRCWGSVDGSNVARRTAPVDPVDAVPARPDGH